MVATDGAPYLLALRLAGRRVLIAGGGAVAARRVPALLDSGAEVVIVSPGLSPVLEDLAAAGRLRWTAREYAGGDCAGAWLVCACTDDPGVNAAVAADADIAHRLGCVPGLPVLRIDRLYRDRELTPLELAVNHFHPDRYSYRIQLRAQPDSSSR